LAGSAGTALYKQVITLKSKASPALGAIYPVS